MSAPTTATPVIDPADYPLQERVEVKLTPLQWKSGIAAWLGWLFDGLDMHLYTIVAAPFVAELLRVTTADPAVKEKSSWIMAAFLVGWALGGAFFGLIGDRLGRSRALSLTILTYALFTGLSFFAESWWQLLIFRFLAALGIGGEWAVGSALLSETWPRRWRPWIAAVLQTGVNIGVMLAYAATWLLADYPPRYVFLVGILPAFLVLWIRRAVPEPEEWHAARRSDTQKPRVLDLFRGSVGRTTILTVIVCAGSLTAWWAVMFWTPQLMPRLPDVASWSATEQKRLASTTLGIMILASVPGNFFAGWLAKRLGYKYAVAVLCAMFFASVFSAFGTPRGHTEMLYLWLPMVGFCSGLFGLFTMFLPPLFPVLLRTTGAGFSYNIGRIAAAAGTVVFGIVANNQFGDLRIPLFYGSFLFLPPMIVALFMPNLRDD